MVEIGRHEKSPNPAPVQDGRGGRCAVPRTAVSYPKFLRFMR